MGDTGTATIFSPNAFLSRWFTTGNVLKMETVQCSCSCNRKLPLSTNATSWRGGPAHLNRALGWSLCAFSGNTFRMSKACFRNIAAEGEVTDCFETLTNVFLLLFAHRDGCIQRRGVISRMFPAAESAFIITAPDILLGLNPSLILVAATTSTQLRFGDGECCLNLCFSCNLNKTEHGVQSYWQGKKSERETSTFSRFLGVLACSNSPQSQHHQLNLIHKFDHPCAFKRNLYGERTTFQFH